MSITSHGYVHFDYSVIKVGERWYICSDAEYVNVAPRLYEYATPTLKFKAGSLENGLDVYKLDGLNIEVIGQDKSLVLEYVC